MNSTTSRISGLAVIAILATAAIACSGSAPDEHGSASIEPSSTTSDKPASLTAPATDDTPSAPAAGHSPDKSLANAPSHAQTPPHPGKIRAHYTCGSINVLGTGAEDVHVGGEGFTPNGEVWIGDYDDESQASETYADEYSYINGYFRDTHCNQNRRIAAYDWTAGCWSNIVTAYVYCV